MGQSGRDDLSTTEVHSLDYYESVAGPHLADEFLYTELQVFFQKAADSPNSYNVRERDLRPVNLNKFLYHFLFQVVEDPTNVVGSDRVGGHLSIDDRLIMHLDRVSGHLRFEPFC